jgi:hypothetical protein
MEPIIFEKSNDFSRYSSREDADCLVVALSGGKGNGRTEVSMVSNMKILSN